MMSSLAPVGERARGQRWSVTATAHVAGAVVGGATLGAVVGLAGAVVDRSSGIVMSQATWALVALAGIAAAAAVVEQGPLAVPVPWVRRQVDERWLGTYRGWVYGAGFGAQLGFGLVTIVPTWATPAMLVVMALTGSPVGGAIVGAVYGLSRGLPVLATARLTEPPRLWAFHERLDRWRAAGARATVVGLAGIAVVSLIVVGAGA